MAHGLLQGRTQKQYYDSGSYGGYQFIDLRDVISNFIATYTGEDKILEKTSRTDVSFHAHRALAELSFDVFKSCKAQEIEIPASLAMILPQDYVNYIKLTWSDSSGIEHVIYPARKTSNPTAIFQNDDGDYALTAGATTAPPGAGIALDGEYKNILVGMRVDVPYNGTTTQFASGFLQVYSVSNTGGVTTVSLQDSSGAIWVPPSVFSTTITFHKPDGSLVLQEESSHIVEGLTWNTTLPIMTATSTASIANIEVGMQVSNRFFPQGTTVTSINGLVVTVSAVGILPNVAGDDVTFISFNPISDTWSKYKSATPSENQDDYNDDTYWPANGERYGLDPQHSQTNGSFFIDDCKGMIYFSSNLSGKTVILKYISDSLGNDTEMKVHKLAEEAIYKWIMYGCLSAKINIPEYVIRRFKKEKYAETRKAKLRLSNIKLEEITQILRGKSKHIKH
jgi:hypothetical protein